MEAIALRQYSPDGWDLESSPDQAPARMTFCQTRKDNAMPQTEIAKPADRPVSRPRDVFSAMPDEMDHLFQRFEHGWPRWPSLFSRDGVTTLPELDVRESTSAVTVEAELPGVDEKDVSVTLANGVLTIKGEKRHQKEEKAESYYLAERSFGSFERSIRLPDSIDDAKVEAKFDKGVLKVTAVKAERKIEIRRS